MAAIAWEEIKAHNTEADTWIVVHGNGNFSPIKFQKLDTDPPKSTVSPSSWKIIQEEKRSFSR